MVSPATYTVLVPRSAGEDNDVFAHRLNLKLCDYAGQQNEIILQPFDRDHDGRVTSVLIVVHER